ncbi:MAG: type II toxin-antitoxin system VapC family toxin [Akkermansiaceae bacterium]|nr:type II toxin-antitoxin system VapC family toxin [Akkermansiaceae bacterium]NNM29008.1 type II toxin-antitoxin system VapC family toxin [Akkermansiaceae bacterium]
MPAEEEAYFDTAFLFRLYWDDAGFEAVREFASSTPGISCALHGKVEFLAAAHRKFREGAERGTINTLLDQFLIDGRDGGIEWLPLTSEVMARVDGVYRQAPADTFLRAADALHLATASVAGHRTIYSNDRHLLAAAPLFGLEGVDLTSG